MVQPTFPFACSSSGSAADPVLSQSILSAFGDTYQFLDIALVVVITTAGL